MSKSSSAASLNGLSLAGPNEGTAALEAGDDEGEEREGAGGRDAGAALDMPEPLGGPVPLATRRRGSSAASSATGSDGKSRGVMWFGGSVSTVEAKETLKRRKVEQVIFVVKFYKKFV